jgi:hypothetical protein
MISVIMGDKTLENLSTFQQGANRKVWLHQKNLMKASEFLMVALSQNSDDGNCRSIYK